jgi:hypothetical protein
LFVDQLPDPARHLPFSLAVASRRGTIADMSRHPPKQLSAERRRWIAGHVERELAVWGRIVHTMGTEGFDPRTPEYRRAWDAYIALKNAAAQHRPRQRRPPPRRTRRRAAVVRRWNLVARLWTGVGKQSNLKIPSPQASIR